MNVKELRLQTGLSQIKFANLFEIPVATLKDWEQGRRVPPQYVVSLMKKYLELQGIIINEDYFMACEKRRKSVEKAMAIVLTATNGVDEEFYKVLESYIYGKITLEEIEKRVNRLEYLGA